MSLRLLALDIDGTLTDPKGTIRPGIVDAIDRARRLGLRVIPCTGRRYRTLRPVLDRLGLSGEVVVQNGALVKQAHDGRTLHPLYLDASLCEETLDAMREAGPPLVYVDEAERGLDIVTATTDRTHPFQTAYLEGVRGVSRIEHGLERMPSERTVVMMSWMADAGTLATWRTALAARLQDRVRINLIRNVGQGGAILEVCHRGSGKWSALQWIARRLEIRPDEIAAVGDDANDLEMIRHAALGIAMAHSPEAVRRAADHVTLSNDEDGLAHALETWILPAAVRT